MKFPNSAIVTKPFIIGHNTPVIAKVKIRSKTVKLPAKVYSVFLNFPPGPEPNQVLILDKDYFFRQVSVFDLEQTDSVDALNIPNPPVKELRYGQRLKFEKFYPHPKPFPKGTLIAFDTVDPTVLCVLFDTPLPGHLPDEPSIAMVSSFTAFPLNEPDVEDFTQPFYPIHSQETHHD